MTTVNVNASQSYDVLIGEGFLSSGQIGEQVKAVLPKAEKVFVISDDNVAKLYLAPVIQQLEQVGFHGISNVIEPGEISKNGNVFMTLLSLLAHHQITRTDVIVALGGGVIGDLAGFVAACYLRGVPFVQIPTTLLAMVDSSVGGKTAIDLPQGKNLAGAFYQPRLVICDTAVLSTLSEEIFNDGMAEVIKYGMLGDSELLEKLKAELDLEDIVATCVKMKRDIVERDEFDLGDRMLLNFGHTVGHAIEKLSNYKVTHGCAVAVGMAMVTRFCLPEASGQLEELLGKYKLPTQTDYAAKDIFEAVLSDKKRAGGEITEIVPVEFGKCELKKIPIEELLGWLGNG